MTGPALLLYCQHSVGMGHLMRSLALPLALTTASTSRWYRVERCHRLPKLRGALILPPVGLDEHGALVSRDHRRRLDRALDIRRRMLLDAYRASRPRASSSSSFRSDGGNLRRSSSRCCRRHAPELPPHGRWSAAACATSWSAATSRRSTTTIDAAAARVPRCGPGAQLFGVRDARRIAGSRRTGACASASHPLRSRQRGSASLRGTSRRGRRSSSPPAADWLESRCSRRRSKTQALIPARLRRPLAPRCRPVSARRRMAAAASPRGIRTGCDDEARGAGPRP